MVNPDPEGPSPWITRVRVTVTGMSDSANLQSASASAFAVGESRLYHTFATTVSLRNQLFQTGVKADELWGSSGAGEPLNADYN